MMCQRPDHTVHRLEAINLWQQDHIRRSTKQDLSLLEDIHFLNPHLLQDIDTVSHHFRTTTIVSYLEARLDAIITPFEIRLQQQVV